MSVQLRSCQAAPEDGCVSVLSLPGPGALVDTALAACRVAAQEWDALSRPESIL